MDTGRDAGDGDDTEPLPIPTLGGYPVRPGPELGTALPPFDFSALDLNRAPSRRGRWALVAGVVAVVAVVAGVIAVGVPSSEEPSAAPAEAPPTVSEDTRDPEAEERLAKLVTASYPTDTCAPVSPPAEALAQLSCRAGADPVERPAARYTLAADRDTMIAMFDRLVSSSKVVVCPGRIQSPVHCPTGRVEGVQDVASVMMGSLPAR